MHPVRMCCVCKKRFEKDELIRIVKCGSGVKIDFDKKMQGRGAYICKCAECAKNAQKRRALERALSCAVDACVYEELKRR